MGTATTTTSEYLVGTLVVDIFDAKSKALMFRGTASDEISDKPEKNIKKVEKASRQDVQGLPSGIQGEEVGARHSLVAELTDQHRRRSGVALTGKEGAPRCGSRGALVRLPYAACCPPSGRK